MKDGEGGGGEEGEGKKTAKTFGAHGPDLLASSWKRRRILIEAQPASVVAVVREAMQCSE